MLNGLNSVLNMKTPVVAFDQDQEKVLEGRGLLRECEIFAKVVLLYCNTIHISGLGHVLRAVQHCDEDVRAGRGGLGRGGGRAVPDPRLPRLPGTARWVWRQRRRRGHL